MKNTGSLERALRVAAGLVLLSFTRKSLFGLIGIVPLATGLTGYCPLYQLLGTSTSRAS